MKSNQLVDSAKKAWGKMFRQLILKVIALQALIVVYA